MLIRGIPAVWSNMVQHYHLCDRVGGVRVRKLGQAGKHWRVMRTTEDNVAGRQRHAGN